MKQRAWSAACVLLVLTCHAVAENDAGTNGPAWPRFRGVNGNGVAAGRPAPPVEFGPDKNVVWKVQLPSGHSSPCIWDDRILLTTFEKDARRLGIVCLRCSDGEVLWQKPVPAEAIEKGHPSFNPASATAATDGKRVCAYFGSCGLVCFDMEGQPLWTFPMPTAKLFSGHGASPVMAGGLVLLYRATTKDHFLLAVDAETGKEAWRRDFDSRAQMKHSGAATPIIAGEHVIVHTIDGVSAFDVNTGKVVWWIDAATTATASPILAGDRVLVATWVQSGEPSLRPEYPSHDKLLAKRDANKDDRLTRDEVNAEDLALALRPEGADAPLAFARVGFDRLDRNKDGALGKREWDGFVSFMKFRNLTSIKDHGLLSIKLGGKGNVTATHVETLEKKAIPEVPTPVEHAGRAYMVKNGGILTVIDLKTGKRVVRQRVGTSGTHYASPILVFPHLYVADGKGRVVVVDVTMEPPKVVADNDMGEPIFATPAVVEDHLYVRTARRLYAISHPR